MHPTFFSLASAISFVSFFHTAISHAVEIPGLGRRQTNFTIPSDKFCVQNDYLNAIRAFNETGIAFCSSFLSIPLITETLPPFVITVYVGSICGHGFIAKLRQRIDSPDHNPNPGFRSCYGSCSDCHQRCNFNHYFREEERSPYVLSSPELAASTEDL